MAVVQLKSPAELKRALRQFGTEAEDMLAKAMQDAARFGVAAILRTSAQTRPRPKASGTYERSWLVNKLKDGATISNSAMHAVFVERGRKPGRRPPKQPLVEWVYQKRLAKRPKPPKGPPKGKANEEGGPGKKPPGAKKPKGKKRRKSRQILDVDAFVERVQWKIARRGIEGRFILRRTMPAIAKRAARESKRAIAKLAARPPTGKGSG